MITEQVWIVDDDSSIRWVLEKAFANSNISCAAFESAENLLIALDHGQPEVIISDIRMPGLNGYEVFQAATELWPDQIVVLMTGFGYDPHHSIMRATQEGMDRVLFKPFRTDQLIEIVQKVCLNKVGD